MKKITFILSFILIANILSAQEKLITRSGKVSFKSETPMETIYAESNQLGSILFKSQNKIVFNILMKSFHFDKALMEEHFNEKYVHSDRYPSAKFIGAIKEDIDWDSEGTYKDVEIKGKMTLHGVTKDLAVKGDFEINKKGDIVATSDFQVQLDQFDIKIPNLVEDKISNLVDTSISLKYN